MIDAELATRFRVPSPDASEVYRSDAVDGRAWSAVQVRIPYLRQIDPYQAVFVPAPVEGVVAIALPNVADPLNVSSLDALMAALQDFAQRESLPVDDVELMQLAAHYLEEEEEDADLHVQIYVQMMQTAKQAVAHGQPFWIVV